jgi:hypothetical protein
MSRFNLKKFQECFRKGDYVEIAKRINQAGKITVKRHQVAFAINGKNVTNAHIILNAAIDYLEERDRQEKEFADKLEKRES